jgi:hypothetical protein
MHRATGTMNAVMVGFLAGRLPSRARGGAKPPSQPHGRSLMHDVPSARVCVRPETTRVAAAPGGPSRLHANTRSRIGLRAAKEAISSSAAPTLVARIEGRLWRLLSRR